MYLEYMKKIQVLRSMLERAIADDDRYPDKHTVDQLLEDISTRYSVFRYEAVKPNTLFDVDKFNRDVWCIRKDLDILYGIVSELAGRKYVELEAFINGYLTTLEDAAEAAEGRARESLAVTSIGASTIYYSDTVPAVSFENNNAVISLGSIGCTGGSRILGAVNGYGFRQEDAVFDFGRTRILPYSVNRETMTVPGTPQRNTYTYTLPEASAYRTTFKIANSNIRVDERNVYEAYGGANRIAIYEKQGTHLDLLDADAEYYAPNQRTYSFYIMNATAVRFDFSTAPISRSFQDDEITGLQRDRVYYFTFTMPAGGSVRIGSDGMPYATKEKLAVNDMELYVAGHTQATDFLIYEYQPGERAVLDNVTLTIHGVDENSFRIESIAVKEIVQTGGIAN